MFTRVSITTRVNEQPFKPFRVVTSGGQSYDVVHPELILVGTRECKIAISDSKDSATHDKIAQVSILHITALEDLTVTKSAPDDNGQG